MGPSPLPSAASFSGSSNDQSVDDLFGFNDCHYIWFFVWLLHVGLTLDEQPVVVFETLFHRVSLNPRVSWIIDLTTQSYLDWTRLIVRSLLHRDTLDHRAN